MSNQIPIRERVTDDESTEKTNIRAAIYARTSSTSQTHGYSLEQQVRQSIQRCRQRGWEVTFIYRDEAESGGNTDRPMFQTMLQVAKQQAFDVIVFWRLDRFSRSLIHAVQLEEDLREHDVELYSVTEQIDTTTPTGRFNFRNIANAAEFERELIKQRTQAGLEGMAAEYKWPNETPPLGYTIDESQRLVIDDNERELVEEIFSLYTEMRSMPQVAAELNERGIRTAEDEEWTPRAVGDILRNEIYTGQYNLASVSEHVPEYQIIDDELFEEVTELRHRFQNEDASQETMPHKRKQANINTIKQMYEDFLQMT
jgi:site-specific DNA recombinase